MRHEACPSPKRADFAPLNNEWNIHFLQFLSPGLKSSGANCGRLIVPKSPESL